MDEKIISERHNPGLDLIELHGAPGYQTEHITISRSVSNGLRIEISGEGSTGCRCFHIQSLEAARLIARKLLEFSEQQFGPSSMNETWNKSSL